MEPVSAAAEGLVQVVQHDNLWILSSNDISNATVDAWYATVRAYQAAVAPSNERYLIYDISAVPNASLTPYIRQRVAELADRDRRATGRIAIVIKASSFVVNVFEIFTALTMRRLQPRLQVGFFAELDAARAWVEEGMPPA